MEQRERIDLVQQFGLHRLWRWRTGILNGHSERHVTIGRLADGRWFVDDTRAHGGAWVCRGEADAFDVADWVMARSGLTWTRTPAAFDGRGGAVEAGWVALGQRWFRADGEVYEALSSTRRFGEGEAPPG